MSGATDRFMTSKQQVAQWQEAGQINSRIHRCPDCGGQTHFMGIDFKAPKKSDIKGWRKVEKFILSGKIYYRGMQ